jgi:fructosamine-3-kinase
MLSLPIRDKVIGFLSKRASIPVEISSAKTLSGGSVNQAFQLKTNIGDFFLKYNSASEFPQMFEKEAKGFIPVKTFFQNPKLIDTQITKLSHHEILKSLNLSCSTLHPLWYLSLRY